MILAIPFLMTAVTAVLVVGFLVLLRLSIGKKLKSFGLHVTMLLSTGVGLAFLLIVLASEFEQGGTAMQVMGGIVVGTLGLSSTTILGNALAGLQLRIVGAFQIDDYLRVGDHFGRVTVRGLFHTEIQTEDSDLDTLPNLFLVSNPYRVVREKSTIVSAQVSLGYDTPPNLEECLLRAAEEVGLEEAFVHVVELGDYAVTYRVAGRFRKVKEILSCRSNLRRKVMETLHQAKIEIVSPAFMATRDLPKDVRPELSATEKKPDARPAEEIIFDKADEAGLIEKTKSRLENLATEIADAKARHKAASDEDKPAAAHEIESLVGERDALTLQLEELAAACEKERGDE